MLSIPRCLPVGELIGVTDDVIIEGVSGASDGCDGVGCGGVLIP